MQMRVRSNREKSEPRSRPGGAQRRQHVSRAPAQPEPEADLTDERRMRESGGPDDRAVYTCSCGYVFQADVTTSVTCPHCGSGQAW
jgi:rubrerythrin